jgi:hypothetical protein
MSKEVVEISEMADLIMSEIIQHLNEAGTQEIEYQVVLDTVQEKFATLLKKFLEISYLNDLLQPHGYSVRPLNRSLCIVSANGEGSDLQATCDYRYNMTEAETDVVLGEIIPKMKLLDENTVDKTDTTVISFPEIQRIGLGSFFSHQDSETGLPTKSVIILLFHDNDQVSLYKHRPSLSRRLIEASDRFSTAWPSTEFMPGSFTDLLSVGRFHIETRRRFDRDSVSFQLLGKASKKNLDRVIRNIIIGKQVVLAGDPILGELVVRTLEVFAIHRVMALELRAREKSSADIVTTSGKLMGEYTDPETVVVDLEKAKVIGGSPSKFCQKLLKQIGKKKRLDAIALVETEVKRIVTQATALADLAQDGESQEDRLSQFRNELHEDSLEIVTEIAAAANPLIIQGIRKTSEAISSVESYFAKF